MDMRCIVCLASSSAKMYHSLNNAFDSYFKSSMPVLSILQKVTASTISISPNWPKEICTACLKSLKECYNFIDQFHTAQNFLTYKVKSGLTITDQGEEHIILKIESDGDENVCDDIAESLFVNGEGNISSGLKVEALNCSKNLAALRMKEEMRNTEKSDLKLKSRLNIGKDVKVLKRNVVETEFVEDSNSDSEDGNEDIDHSYTKELDETSDEIIDYESDEVETIKIINVNEDTTDEEDTETYGTDHSRKKPPDNVILMSIDDVMKIRPRRKKKVSANNRPETPSSQNPSTISTSFNCSVCNKMFFSHKRLSKHKCPLEQGQVGLPEKYMCPHCGKRFKYSNALKYHLVSVHQTEERQYQCSYCGFKCITENNLRRHERCHTNERPYKCKFCPKSFRGGTELRDHHLIHENPMRHLCKYCLKGFVKLWNKKIHCLQHKGSHTCELCNKGFADADILKFHYFYKHRIRKEDDMKEMEEIDEDEPKLLNPDFFVADNAYLVQEVS